MLIIKITSELDYSLIKTEKMGLILNAGFIDVLLINYFLLCIFDILKHIY